jgi:hypothetical protein
MSGGADDKINFEIPDWLIARPSEFKGIWIPGPVPMVSDIPLAEQEELFRPSPLGDERNWALVCELFKAHGLDPANPYDWQALLLKLALDHDSRRPGATKEWTEVRLCQLAADVEFAQSVQPALSPGEFSDVDICKRLAAGKLEAHNKFPEWIRKELGLLQYKCRNWKTLYRRLPDGRKRLSELVTVLAQWMRKDFERWTPSHEARVRDWAVSRLAGHGGLLPPSVLFLFLDDLRARLRGNPPT